MIRKILRQFVPSPLRRNGELGPSERPFLLPPGLTERQLYNFVTSIRVDGAPEAEMRAYATQDYRRFIQTWSLARGYEGKCLELGGTPTSPQC